MPKIDHLSMIFLIPKNYICKEIFSREARREFGVSKVNKVMDGLKLMQNS